jgi:hypothetical protein
MLLSVACSALAAFAPQNQNPGQDPPPVLTEAETKKLHDRLKTMISAFLKYDESVEAARAKAATAYEKDKVAFQKDWDLQCEKKGDLMKSVADLREIFDNVFEYDGNKFRGTDALRKETPSAKEFPPYAVWVPKSYKADVPMRTVLLLPGFDDKNNQWQDARSTFAGTWEKSASEKDTIFHIPTLRKEMLHEMDRYPDYSRQGEDQREFDRNQDAFKSFGETARAYNYDRRRLFLDCGRETSGFGVRLVCNFPDRFAGIIVRWPVDMKETRLGSLTGMPVLIVSTAATAPAATELKERLEKLGPGNVTVVAATDDYPFKASTPEIEKWMQGVQRNLMRPKVVLEPNDDRYKKGFWAEIDRMDSIVTAPPTKKPRLEVNADRSLNRIEVKSVGVETFVLYLNDSLVDLSKPFTVVINGKAKTPSAGGSGTATGELRTRDFMQMWQMVIKKFDGGWVFPVVFMAAVPQEDKAGGGSTEAPANGGKAPGEGK